MQTIEMVLGGVVKKGDHSKLVKAFAEKKGYRPKNQAQWKYLFSTQGKAAKLLLEMAGDLPTALKALDEIGDWLDSKTEKDGWLEWTNMAAINTQFMSWQKSEDAENGL